MRANILVAGLVVALTLCLAGSQACSCNGIINSEGRGECRTSYRGKQWCYVNKGECTDEQESSSSERFWSYEACEECPRSPVIKGRSRHCCTPDQPCGIGEGDCDIDDDCGDGLKCGDSNCAQFRPDNYARADCCYNPEVSDQSEALPSLQEKVYTLDPRGFIECNLDSDCPPPPHWEWNDETKMEYGVSSITEMSIEVSFCSTARLEAGGICLVKLEPFCGHEDGRSHPECQRCNVLTPLPEPKCLDYRLSDAIDIDQCCNDIFDVNFIPELEALQNFRQEILQDFTRHDCQLSALHLPPGAPPRTSFDRENICCEFGYCLPSFDREKICCVPSFDRENISCEFEYCPTVAESDSGGVPPTSLSAVTGIGSLSPNSLAQNSPSCPAGHCKRPSIARPEELICCLRIQAPWRRRNIFICPNSCD